MYSCLSASITRRRDAEGRRSTNSQTSFCCGSSCSTLCTTPTTSRATARAKMPERAPRCAAGGANARSEQRFSGRPLWIFQSPFYGFKKWSCAPAPAPSTSSRPRLFPFSHSRYSIPPFHCSSCRRLPQIWSMTSRTWPWR